MRKAPISIITASTRGVYEVWYEDGSVRRLVLNWPRRGHSSYVYDEMVRVYNDLPHNPNVLFQPEPIDEEDDR